MDSGSAHFGLLAYLSVKEAMGKLVSLFASKTRSRVMSLKKRLTLSSEGNKSVTEFLQSMRGIADELALAQSPVSDEDMIIFILNGLNPEFRELSTDIRARESDISLEELYEKLTDFEVHIKEDENISPVISANYTNKGRPSENLKPQFNRVSGGSGYTPRPTSSLYPNRSSHSTYKTCHRLYLVIFRAYAAIKSIPWEWLPASS